MQANCSFLVTDPKGEMLRAVAPLLIQKGYIIKVFDLIDPANSDAFNPFPYIRDDKDAMKLVHNLIRNTTPKNASNNDPFWEKSEIALDTALILYLLHEAPPEEQNFEMVMYMIENGGAREDSDDFQSPLDLLFEALEEEDPSHIAVREYKIFKQAAGKTAKSILLSAAVRLSAFILPQIVGITTQDDMELGLMGDRKQAVFAIIPDNDGTFNYLVGMLYTCAFQALYYQADKVHQGALPVPVRLMMDEFCNVSLPDDFGKLQATMRSRNIMSTIVLQNISALKALFKFFLHICQRFRFGSLFVNPQPHILLDIPFIGFLRIGLQDLVHLRYGKTAVLLAGGAEHDVPDDIEGHVQGLGLIVPHIAHLEAAA